MIYIYSLVLMNETIQNEPPSTTTISQKCIYINIFRKMYESLIMAFLLACHDWLAAVVAVQKIDVFIFSPFVVLNFCINE
mmetsp:Transcript_30582/g.52831  ORF Transcript_30582/g.52831 Transcript_30582/m.52831 type:complete len:80 (-) Transcript_30582:34-273(-)